MKPHSEKTKGMEFFHSLEAFFVASHKHYGETLGLDYQHLNRLPYFREFTPSTEHIAQFIAESMTSLGCEVREVEVFETDGLSGGISICGN